MFAAAHSAAHFSVAVGYRTIDKQRPPASVLRPPAKEELAEARQSVLPGGIAIEIPDLPTAALTVDDCHKSMKRGSSQASDKLGENGKSRE